MNKDKAKEQAKKGNIIFDKFCQQQNWCQVKKFSNKEFSSWDAAVVSATTTNCITEIKVRGTKYPTMLLEVGKLQGLRESQAEVESKKGIETKILYVNHIPNNETLIWDITDINLDDYEISQRWLQKSDYDETPVLKDVIFLPVDDAILNTSTNNELSIYKK